MTILRIDERVGVAGKGCCMCFIRRIAAWVHGADKAIRRLAASLALSLVVGWTFGSSKI
jgi:hypothetical protein